MISPPPIGVKRTSSHQWIKPQVEANFDVKQKGWIRIHGWTWTPVCPRDSKTNSASRKQLLTVGLKNPFRIPPCPYLLYCIPRCIPSNVHPYDSINSLIPSSYSVNPRLLKLSMNGQTRKALVQSAAQASRLQVESVKSQKLPPLRCVAFFNQVNQSNRTCTCNTFLKSKCWFTRMTKIVENKVYVFWNTSSWFSKRFLHILLSMHPRVAQNLVFFSAAPGASLLCCWLLLHLNEIKCQPKRSILHLHETYLFLKKQKKRKIYQKKKTDMFITLLGYSCYGWCTQDLTLPGWYIFTYGRCEDVPLWLDLFLDKHLWHFTDSSLQKWCYQTYEEAYQGLSAAWITRLPMISWHDCGIIWNPKHKQKTGKMHQKRKNMMRKLLFLVSSSSQIIYKYIHHTQQTCIWAGHVSKIKVSAQIHHRCQMTLEHCFCWVGRSAF